MIKRRDFIKTTGLVLASAPLIGYTTDQSKKEPDPISKHPICIFSKHLHWLDFEEMGRYAKDLGFDGIELTVRKGGHIEPEDAEKVLPGAIEKITKSGISVPSMVTNIMPDGNPLHEKVIRTAAANGIRMYRLNYQHIDRNIEILSYLDNLVGSYQRLAAINAQYNITGMYQNHDGTDLGAAVWDIAYVLKKVNSPFLGLQYDLRHNMVEGGKSWINDFSLVKNMIKSTVVKDFIWHKDSKGQWRVKNVPLGEGMVTFSKFYDLYKENGLHGPVSMHIEYPMFSQEEKTMRKKEMNKEAEVILTKELATVRKWMAEAGIQ
ncbi:MAG: sugar phosphate isomerase/epimerase [Cyclobacteriaceae bacterium]|nr:sugar phosphate isomerase/epimerase [Cyclobacteriaceae bacterium]